MDRINLLVLISRWLHIGSAIVAVGGAVFVRFALLPASSSTLDDATHERLREAIRKRWVIYVHACVAVLFLTGAVNFLMLAVPPRINAIPYHPIFGVKLLAAFGVFFIAIVMFGRGAGFAGMRAKRAKWLTILIVLAGLIVLISGVLNQIRTGQIAVKLPAATASP